ncbi:MAG: magnesium transporter CorA family protein [Pseudonocardiaceae bacterium]
MTRTRLYRSGVLETENFPVEHISQHLTQPGVTVWLDLCAPDADDLIMISNELDLHRLAVEDAGHERQRPKLDRYDSHLFVTAYAVALDMTTGELETFEVAVFVTHNALVTVRKSDQFDINGVVAHWDASPDLAKHGVSFLLHGLLDYVVDGHFTAVQILDDEIEALEDLLFDDNRSDLSVQRRSFELRKSLVQLRRVVLPMREVVNSLMRRDLRTLDQAMTPYYQDVYDHVLRATEWTESLRDLVTTVLETNLTIQGNRLNVITKKVTSWAAIIAVPTAITGFYGQNVPYPGFGHESGFYISTIAIVVISIGLYFLFRHHDWI